MLFSTFARSTLCFLAAGTSASAIEQRQSGWGGWSSSTSSSGSYCSANVQFTSDSYHYDILESCINFWSGNYSLLNQTVSPAVKLYQDRIPSGTYVINSSAALQGWIDHSRNGWDRFLIKARYWFGSEYQVAFRWYLDGIIGNVSAHAPGSSLPDHSPVTYNGTDILFLNPCTGLIDEIDSAQDFIEYFYELGLKEVPI